MILLFMLLITFTFIFVFISTYAVAFRRSFETLAFQARPQDKRRGEQAPLK
jgi:hypothetical protein